MSSPKHGTNASSALDASPGTPSAEYCSFPDEQFGERIIDLRLPRLSVLTDYNDKSYTRVKLAAVLPGNVTFVPWLEFDDLVTTTVKKVNAIPEYLLGSVNSWLENCRRVIDPETYGPPDACLSEKVKEWFENPDSIPSGFEAKDRIEPEDYLNKQELDSSSERPGRRGIQGLSSVGPSTGFTISAPGGMKTYKQGMSVQEAKHIGIPVYLNSTSCTPLNTAVMIVIEQLLRIIRGKNDYFMAPQFPLSSELARVYDLDRGPSEFLNLIPDYALTREFHRPAQELPTFTIELKGPLSKFWKSGRFDEGSQKTAENKHKEGNSSSAKSVKSDMIVSVTEKDIVKAESGNRESISLGDLRFQKNSNDENSKVLSERDPSGEDRPLKKFRKGKQACKLNVEVARISRTEDANNYSAEGLAKFYNDLFKDRTILDKDNERHEYYFTFLPVAQALSQALLSKSGYCALYNHQEGVAFKIEKATDTDSVPLLVHVSRAYSCDSDPGNLSMLLTMANESSALIAMDPARKYEMRELFLDIADKFVEEELSKGKPIAGSGGQRNSRLGKGGSVSRSRSCEGGNVGSDESFNTRRTHNPTPVEAENISDFSSERSDVTMSNSVIKDCDKDAGMLSQAFVDVFRNNHGVMDSGASGTVFGGTFGGRLVAIKSWNGITPEGLENLLNEIRIYKALGSKQAKVLGAGIPSMRLSRTMPKDDAVLVIDYVGKCVRRLADGSLALYENRRYEILNDHAAQEIGNAALRSLPLLHECGIIHGDINLSNLRVAPDAYGENRTWRAWWIDLGLSRDGWIGRLELEVECQRVTGLFPEADFEMIISAV